MGFSECFLPIYIQHKRRNFNFVIKKAPKHNIAVGYYMLQCYVLADLPALVFFCFCCLMIDFRMCVSDLYGADKRIDKGPAESNLQGCY